MIKKLLASVDRVQLKIPRLNVSKSRVGIQLSEKEIKVATLKKEKNEWEIEKQIIEPLNEGIIKGGNILQPEILVLKIKELFANNEIHARKVSVFVEEMAFFNRQIELPKMSKKEVKKSLYYKAQLEIPVDIEQLTLSYSYIGCKEIDEKLVHDYVVFAAYQNQIEKVVHALTKAGLSISFFGTEPDALYEGLKFKGIDEGELKEHVLIVRKDTNRMMIAIFNHHKLVYCRYLPSSMNPVECEQEIERTVVSWNGKNREAQIEEILLLGDRKQWSEVKESIERFLPLDVRLITSLHTASVGIAAKTSNEANFLMEDPLEFANQLSPRMKLVFPVIILGVVGAIILQGYSMMLKSDINKLKDNISGAYEVVQLLNQENELKGDFAQLREIENRLNENNIDILAGIGRIAFHQPQQLEMTQLSFSKENILISGSAFNQDQVISFLKGLQGNQSFSKVILHHTSASGEGVQFSLEIMNNLVGEENEL